ncbi:uncharacterized protein BXZ73DRAFT_3163, partial [Epithele typhae]|uniref:uncharacterized protein n=1 Tax=Epithele typhae TaxID=378194 RepID=UPI002008C0A4
ENALLMLAKYDTVIVVDDSGSMSINRRWQMTEQALKEVTTVAATYDKDGIDVHFLNNAKFLKNAKDPSDISRLFRSVQPDGLTPTGGKLDELLTKYLDKLDAAKKRGNQYDVKPVNFIVITDGQSSDDPVDVIVRAAKRLDEGHYLLSQVGIQFLQIGRDLAASEALRVLDDELAAHENVRDIVDTTPYYVTGGKITGTMIIKILLGGINRRVDRSS